MDYKEDILRSRTGCVGSSDGVMLARIAREGKVPASYNKRLAVIKGIIEPTDNFKTKAMELGDLIENAIFHLLRIESEEYISNPRWESVTYSKDNVRLISHPDIVRFDEAHKTLHIYEVKATKFSVEETLKTYEAQLYIHYIMGVMQVFEKSGEWRVKVHLVHYSTLGDPVEFDPNRITIKDVVFDQPPFDINKALDILNETLYDFTYQVPEEVSTDDLPMDVQGKLKEMSSMLKVIKEYTDEVDKLKKRIYELMERENIKSIDNPYFTITRVDPTTSRTFDSKAWLKDYEKTDPEGAKQLKEQYTKEVTRSGYALIKQK